MTHSNANISGNSMDQALPRRRWRGGRLKWIAAVAAMAAAAMLAWSLMPRGLRVPLAEVRIAVVEQGVFRDDAVVRATAAPLHSVMLDAVESGRVEEVFVRDGAKVKKGDALFRLSNPQRRLEMLARESEHAQQISNLTNMRVTLEAANTERQRRASELAFALEQARKQHERQRALAAKGFVSASALEEAADRVVQQQRLFDLARESNRVEAGIQRNAIEQMEQATARLAAGLRLVRESVDALAVRAPADGRLTDFSLQLGEAVRADQHLGRIDDMERYKLTAQIDEYYLNRIVAGRAARAQMGGRTYALTVSRIFPQIRDGKFNAELTFADVLPQGLHPGQSVDVSITLGEPAQALVLPNDAFVNDTGGTSAYVVQAGQAVRRNIRLGRRSHRQVEVLEGLRAGERVIVSSYAAFGKNDRIELTGK
ncbi:efflux RND transporter periplasmic adaptor subunit [Massilia endophytica]|uniref:efflux RND transporter periplasmic adaptor subunit n=1 Tax=Massilia endophytica TaxID=2899220 RepID=UPI001E2D9A8F|nr:efflux RND transporter periplasmic adaptor subunit [Massilia endophytica]UGQ45435.1 efflux RND transporter periplasmic adaptor subunit [Massilia endophytica]